MKVKYFMAMLLAAASLTCFIACNDDDDDELAEENIAQNIVGKYGDYSIAKSAHFSNMYTKESGEAVTITEVSNTTVAIAFTSATWGEFVFENVVVEKVDNAYTVKGEGTAKIADMSGEVKSYDATFEGSFVGNDYTLTFTASAVMGGITINVYNGTAAVAYLASGNYMGSVNAKVNMGQGVDAGSIDNQELIINYAADDKVNIFVPSFQYNYMGKSMTIPDLNFENIDVVLAENGNITIGETTLEGTASETSYTVVISGSIDANGKVNLIYNVKYGAMPFTITFTFQTADAE